MSITPQDIHEESLTMLENRLTTSTGKPLLSEIVEVFVESDKLQTLFYAMLFSSTRFLESHRDVLLDELIKIYNLEYKAEEKLQRQANDDLVESVRPLQLD